MGGRLGLLRASRSVAGTAVPGGDQCQLFASGAKFDFFPERCAGGQKASGGAWRYADAPQGKRIDMTTIQLKRVGELTEADWSLWQEILDWNTVYESPY